MVLQGTVSLVRRQGNRQLSGPWASSGCSQLLQGRLMTLLVAGVAGDGFLGEGVVFTFMVDHLATVPFQLSRYFSNLTSE